MPDIFDSSQNVMWRQIQVIGLLSFKYGDAKDINIHGSLHRNLCCISYPKSLLWPTIFEH